MKSKHFDMVGKTFPNNTKITQFDPEARRFTMICSCGKEFTRSVNLIPENPCCPDCIKKPSRGKYTPGDKQGIFQFVSYGVKKMTSYWRCVFCGSIFCFYTYEKNKRNKCTMCGEKVEKDGK